jgi:hypothetical protein
MIYYELKNPEQMMALKSYPGTATHFKAADTQIAAVGILPKQCKLLTAGSTIPFQYYLMLVIIVVRPATVNIINRLWY